jgi:hypothetical protein
MDEYRWEQIDWFANALLADKPERGAAFMHIAVQSTPMLDAVTKIANAYNTRASITLNDIIYDFSAVTGKFWFVMAGHTHKDLSYAVNGIPIVVSINALVDPDTITFDLVLVDYDANKIHMVRVGSGDAREILLPEDPSIDETNLFDIGESNADYVSAVVGYTSNPLVVNAAAGTLVAPSLDGGNQSLINLNKIENPKVPLHIRMTISNDVELPAVHGVYVRPFDAAGNVVTDWSGGWNWVSVRNAFYKANNDETLPSVAQFDETITLPDNVETFQLGFQFINPKNGVAGTLVTFSDISVTVAQ